MSRIVFVYPIIRDDFIYKSIETLYKYTQDFTVVVVDQTINGLDREFTDKYVNLLLRMKNRGFAKAANEGLIHGLRWQTPYLSVVNDDTEFMYDGWLEDALSEFNSDPRIIAVNPECPRVPLWGYGRPMGENLDIIDYKEHYTDEDIAMLKSGDHQHVLEKYGLEPADLVDKLPDGKYDWKGKIYVPIIRWPDHPGYLTRPVFPTKKTGVIDGFAGWLPIFKREGLDKVGLFDERFVWGGGEDYDLCARAYAQDLRMVTTMKSWVWHWWGQSKDVKGELDPALFTADTPWNDIDYLWPKELNGGYSMDPWGHWTHPVTGRRIPMKRIDSILVKPL